MRMFIGGRWVVAASGGTIPVISTAGKIVDLLVTETDVAVHPERQRREGLVDGGVCVVPIDELKAIAGRSIAQPMPATRG